MTQTNAVEAPPLDHPRLLPFLPMIYVAWADGDLSAAEMAQIQSHAEDVCGELLAPWLDAEKPPPAVELQRMLAVIRRAAGGLSASEKLSLTSLGVRVAQAGDHVVSDEERRALEEIEGVLGIAGSEAARQLLATRRPAAPVEVPEPAFDVDGLSRFLDGEHRAHRRRVLELLSAPEFRYRYGLETGEYRALVFDWCRRLAAEGLGDAAFPESAGGDGDMERFIVTFETLAFHDLSLLIKFGVQFGLFGGSILNLGTAHHHERYLPRVGSLALPGCFAMSETGHGSNVQDLETVARYDPETGEFVIDTPHAGARKDYIGNAARDGRMATVFAQLEVGEHGHGIHAFLVPIRDAHGNVLDGVRIEDCGEKLGLNGVDNGRLYFDRVRVPRRALLDRFARVDAEGRYESPIASPSKRFFTMLGTLVGGRVSVALGALSATKSALTIAIRYNTWRRQFGPPGEPEIPILDYLSQQRRLLPRLATTYALHFALDHLRREFVSSSSDEDRREVETLAAGLKAYATWHATDTIQTCRECCGGQGYLAINRLPALKSDTDVFTTFEGDNTVLMLLVAKSLLSGYKRQFGQLDMFGLVRYVASRAATSITERNPITTRLTDEGHLRSHDFQLAALRWREEVRVARVARRIKKKLDRGVEISDALIACQDLLLDAAHAHVERLILEQFRAAIDRADDDDLKTVLTLLCDLFALSRLEADRGWFLERGYLESSKARAIRKLINKLCGEVRDLARPLVRAFGIPDAVLAAPIAT